MCHRGRVPRTVPEIAARAQAHAAAFAGFEPDESEEVAALRAAAFRRDRAEEDLTAAITAAVTAGSSWEQVGAVLGLSASAARARYGHA